MAATKIKYNSQLQFGKGWLHALSSLLGLHAAVKNLRFRARSCQRGFALAVIDATVKISALAGRARAADQKYQRSEGQAQFQAIHTPRFT